MSRFGEVRDIDELQEDQIRTLSKVVAKLELIGLDVVELKTFTQVSENLIEARSGHHRIYFAVLKKSREFAPVQYHTKDIGKKAQSNAIEVAQTRADETCAGVSPFRLNSETTDGTA